MNNKLERKYGLFTAICMVVGIVIGSGVFFKAQTILQITNGDMPLGVIAWLIGGAIMLACILTFAGMSQKYEKVNGIVDYAEATVGPKYGYYMGWFLSTIYYPSLTAALALRPLYARVPHDDVPEYAAAHPHQRGRRCGRPGVHRAHAVLPLLLLCRQRAFSEARRQDPGVHHGH